VVAFQRWIEKKNISNSKTSKLGAKNDAESSDKAQKYLASLESITKKVKDFEKANPKDVESAKKIKDDGISEERQKELSLEYIGEPFTVAGILSLFSFLKANAKGGADEKD
jgi:hypothetical protein